MLYLAYGSNLCAARVQRRVPSARFVGPARLNGFELRWHKRSRDGSGKCAASIGLPSDYVSALGGVEVWADPDPACARRNRDDLPRIQGGLP